jgi:hypothetical protein
MSTNGEEARHLTSIVVAGAAAGMLVSPARTWRAWRASRHGGSLFQTRRPYEDLLGMSVLELRTHLGVAQRGLADRPRKLHTYAPQSETSP